MPKYRGPDEGKVGGVEGRKESAEKIKEFYEQQVSRPVVKKPEERAPEKGRADQFRETSRAPRFLDSVRQRIGSGYRSFKLPGTGYHVRDLRSPEAQEEEAARQKGEQSILDEKLAKLKEKSFVNYLGDRQVMQPEAAREIAKEIARLLSDFEKLLIERFEKGKTIEQKSEDGKPHFLEKSESQWRAFFSKFLKRSAWRNEQLKNMQKFIFRGLISLQKGGGKYAMLIGDMTLANGQVEKFARLKILAEIAKLFANVKPGSALESELLKRGISMEEFKYLALAHKHGEKVFRTGAQPTKGMFGALKTEEQIAEQLGLRRKKKGKGYGGPIKWGEDEEGEEKHAFVPWGWWDREERKGRPFWFTTVVFAIIIFMIIAAILLLVKLF